MTMFTPNPIVTERLVLRTFGPEDLDRIRAVVAARAKFLPPGAPGHHASVRHWLSHGVHELQRSGQGVHLAMRTGDRIVGAISLFRTQWGKGTTEVGYGVHPVHRGRGYTPEALRGLADWVFAATALRRIELRTGRDNAASIRVAEKAGFTREGLLRGADLADDGAPLDIVVFGRLRDDPAPRPVPRASHLTIADPAS
jgi:RimJ/RimL family protein N-acetyltransferase